jgi:hypothetical protein
VILIVIYLPDTEGDSHFQTAGLSGIILSFDIIHYDLKVHVISFVHV